MHFDRALSGEWYHRLKLNPQGHCHLVFRLGQMHFYEGNLSALHSQTKQFSSRMAFSF